MKNLLTCYFFLFSSVFAMAQLNLEGINSDALNKLMDGATGSHTDAMVLYRGETMVGAWYFGKDRVQQDALGITMPLAGLAIGILMDQGKIKSLETPVSTWYPEWKEGDKAAIKLRHLLAHTSGLGTHSVNDLAPDASENFIEFALKTDLKAPPGSLHKLNPRAVNLLSGIVAKVAGEPLDSFLNKHLFSKMGITEVSWTKDKAGNVLVMTGLKIFPEDLAAIGVMCLQRGKWKEQQLISAGWFEKAFAPASDTAENGAHLWWRIYGQTVYVIDRKLLDQYREAGVNAQFIEGMSRLQGRYNGRTALIAVFKGALGERWQDSISKYLSGTDMQVARREYQDLLGYNANGRYGQWLVLYPESQLVGVRMIAETSVENMKRDNFNNFGDLMRRLISKPKE